MKKLVVGLIGVIFCFIGCTSQEIATQGTYETIGSEAFSTFKFYISKEVVLKEIVPLDMDLNKKNTEVNITAYNKVVRIKRSTAGRIQGTPSAKKLEIAFEQLKDGTKPPITFVQKNNFGRYYFECTMADWTVVDKKGRYVSVHGPGIEYNGAKYLLEFKGEGEPYLVYDQNIKVKKESRRMKGLK
jgi:hypothetical protein